MELKYHQPIVTPEGYILSIDNIVFDTHISTQRECEELMSLITKLSGFDANVTHWHSLKFGAYKDNFRFELGNGTSFWLGVGSNLKQFDQGRIRMDFNPNKVSHYNATRDLFFFLVTHSKKMHREIKRFDLAIDILIDRFDCFLFKDARTYIERKHGQEWTQYLGAKSSHEGRVKLYNKTVEAHLNQPLTRLELTLSPQTPYTEIQFPDVYVLCTQQVHMDEIKVTDTERFILNAILQGYGSPRDLGRKCRAKMETLLENYIHKLSLSQADYRKILSQLETYRITGNL